MRLTTSMAGAVSPSFHSAATNSAPYLASRASAAPPLVVHSLPSDLNQLASLTAGTGIQAFVLPSGLAISSLVTISKVRQLPGTGLKAPAAEARRGRPADKVTAAPAFRSVRRSKFIVTLPE